MADEVNITKGGVRAKLRSPWAAALLPYVTLGVYHVVWWYRINRELRDYGDAHGQDLGQNPGRSALAMFPGFLVIVPPLVSYVRGTQRIQASARMAGKEPLNPWIALILYFVVPAAFFAYLQVSLNAVWRAEASMLHDHQPAPELRAQSLAGAMSADGAANTVVLGSGR